jgi:16S rRNA (guanine527-N7)-methyltransferase
VLTESRRLGFLGPGPIDEHIDHARGFAQVIGDAGEVLDLGSGGGLPGLVLLQELSSTRFVLLDAASRRCEFLSWAVGELGAGERVEIVCGRAEELARDPALRGRFSLVVARSFGAPAVTAECAVGFLSGPGARVLVSEPPAADVTRWPDDGLASLGLRPLERVTTDGATIQILEMVDELDPALPRRVGVPAKRPRF